MEQQNYLQVIEPEYKIQIGIKDDKAISLHWGELVDNNPGLSNEQILQKLEKYLREALETHLKQQKKSSPVEPEVSKPIYIVYEACFQGDNLLTAFEDREDAEKYIKRAKKNYYISKPIHLVKAC